MIEILRKITNRIHTEFWATKFIIIKNWEKIRRCRNRIIITRSKNAFQLITFSSTIRRETNLIPPLTRGTTCRWPMNRSTSAISASLRRAVIAQCHQWVRRGRSLKASSTKTLSSSKSTTTILITLMSTWLIKTNHAPSLTKNTIRCKIRAESIQR